MSINNLRQSLSDIPGAEKLIMRYEEGTGRQVFSIDAVSVNVSGNASEQEIRLAFQKALAA
jgi:hypothetical protein